MRIFGHYMNPRIYSNHTEKGMEGCGFLIMLIFAFTCFSVINPLFALFWIPALVGVAIGKKIVYRKKKEKKVKDYE